MSSFDKCSFCSFCNMPGAKHEGGIEVNGLSATGSFCNKDCFDKWALWKATLIAYYQKFAGSDGVVYSDGEDS